MRNSTFQTAPAHIQNRPLGLPHRLPAGTCSMPRCSTAVIDGSSGRPIPPPAAVSLAIAGTFLLRAGPAQPRPAPSVGTDGTGSQMLRKADVAPKRTLLRSPYQ